MTKQEILEWIDARLKRTGTNYDPKIGDFKVTDETIYGKPVVNFKSSNICYGCPKLSIPISFNLRKKDTIPFVFGDTDFYSLSIYNGSIKDLDFLPVKGKMTTLSLSDLPIETLKSDRFINYKSEAIRDKIFNLELKNCPNITSLEGLPPIVNSIKVTKCGLKNIDNADFSNVNTLIYFEKMDLSELSFEKVLKTPSSLGTLAVINCKLKSLKGLEKFGKIYSLFVSNNELESLEGSENVTDQIVADDNKIKTLKGCPISLDGTCFSVANNQLENLDYLPKIGQGRRDADTVNLSEYGLSGNRIIDFTGFHKELKNVSVKALVSKQNYPGSFIRKNIEQIRFLIDKYKCSLEDFTSDLLNIWM